jgi:transposase
MVYRHISDDIKQRALWLLDADYLTEDVCEILGVSMASVYRWKENYETYGSVRPPANPVQGRPRILNADQTHDLFTLLAEAPEMYLDEITDWIAVTQDEGISRTAIHTPLRDTGLSYKLLRRAAAERDDVARAEWKQLIQTSFISSMIVTADESSKDERTIFRKRGRAPRGHRAEIEANFVRGERYSILAAITIDGYLGTRIISGSVDGDEFFDFIVNDIVCTSISSHD